MVAPTPRKHIAILSQSLGRHGVLTLIFPSPPSSQDQKAQLLWCFVTDGEDVIAQMMAFSRQLQLEIKGNN